MKVAITGASGFIGRTLCGVVSAAGHEVLTVDLRKPFSLANVRAVVHLAGIAHRRGVSPDELQRVNVGLTQAVGRAAAAAGARMLFASSVKVHGAQSASPLKVASPIAPADRYGESKAKAEEALRAIAGLQLVVLRPPLVYGAGVKANFLFLMQAIARGLPLPLARVANRRSLVYAGNLADAILRCLADPRAVGRTYLVSDGASLSTPALCRAIGEALGRPARLFPFPPAWLPATALKSSLEVDDAAIRRELGWRPPFSMQEGLAATARWQAGS